MSFTIFISYLTRKLTFVPAYIVLKAEGAQGKKKPP